MRGLARHRARHLRALFPRLPVRRLGRQRRARSPRRRDVRDFRRGVTSLLLVALTHDPEKWEPVFGSDHALFKKLARWHNDAMTPASDLKDIAKTVVLVGACKMGAALLQ